VLQSIATLVYCRYFSTYQTPSIPDAGLPNVAVVLCLRGADPFLCECLERLTAQDYPHYDIWVVLDSISDPAAAIVSYWQLGHTSRTIHVTHLKQISEHASLKANALRHAISLIGEDIDAVVLVDADSLTYPLWLRNMVAPLVGGDVAVVTGNRWYSPS